MTGLLIVLSVAALPTLAKGLYLAWFLYKPMDKSIQERTGFDVSNRINRFRLIHKVTKTPWELVDKYPWLTKDEGEQGK